MDVKSWLSNAAHSYGLPNTKKKVRNKSVVSSNNLEPEGSASNICFKVHSKAGSKSSKASSTPSAKIKAQAEKAALQERVAALKQRHELEAQEEHLQRKQDKLRRAKEQLALEAELKETNAKLEGLEINSQCGSKVSDRLLSGKDQSTKDV